MNTLNEYENRKQEFIRKMDELKETQVEEHLQRLDNYEAFMWKVIEKMAVI